MMTESENTIPAEPQPSQSFKVYPQGYKHPGSPIFGSLTNASGSVTARVGKHSLKAYYAEGGELIFSLPVVRARGGSIYATVKTRHRVGGVRQKWVRSTRQPSAARRTAPPPTLTTQVKEFPRTPRPSHSAIWGDISESDGYVVMSLGSPDSTLHIPFRTRGAAPGKPASYAAASPLDLETPTGHVTVSVETVYVPYM
jgi:hypothetical protein